MSKKNKPKQTAANKQLQQFMNEGNQKKAWHSHSKVAPKEERTGQDGFVYDSKTEYQRYCFLNMMAMAKQITNLERQVKYELKNENIFIQTGAGVAVYTPDFVYNDKDGNQIIEDVKGYRDENSKFRIRVFEAIYKVNVTIVKKINNNWQTEK